MAASTTPGVSAEILKNFDGFPYNARIRLPVVRALFGISAPTVWRRVRAGRLPSPRKDGPSVTYWLAGELREKLREGAR